MVFVSVILQVGEIQNEWLQELYTVSLGLLNLLAFPYIVREKTTGT